MEMRLVLSSVFRNGLVAWLAKLNGMRWTTRSGTRSAPSGRRMCSRWAMAPSCQSTVPSRLASAARTTVARGSS